MTPYQEPKKVKRYLFIDRMAKGLGFVEPKEGEELIIYPHSWFEHGAPPFIAHMSGRKVTRTVNCLDLSVIEYEED